MKVKEKEIIRKILDVIRKNKTFVISSHVRPDGDSIGSQLALASFLKRMGKEVLVVSKEEIPEVYSFLPHSNDIRVVDKVNKDFDVGFVLDCSDHGRTANIIDFQKKVKTVVNIDHHVNCELFGDYNYIDPQASSVAEQLYNLFTMAEKGITGEEALALYVGILTDTGGFQEGNTTARAHLVAAELLQKGISPQQVSQNIYGACRKEALKLLSLTLGSLEIVAEGKIAYVVTTQDMFRKTGANEEEVEGFVNFARDIRGVEVGIHFRENKQGGFKVSFRSKGAVDVDKIARKFGGGGHKNASGCSLPGNWEEVREKVIGVVRREMGLG